MKGATARFWSKVNKTDSCWLWTASTRHGYGGLWLAGKTVQAHRYAYELLVGPIPEGLTLDHLCRNPECVNPAHLEPVTQRENIRRGETGLATGAMNTAKTHCPQGHAYDVENTRHYKGRRFCRTCQRVAKMSPNATTELDQLLGIVAGEYTTTTGEPE